MTRAFSEQEIVRRESLQKLRDLGLDNDEIKALTGK